jgi:hypothetical protein
MSEPGNDEQLAAAGADPASIERPLVEEEAAKATEEALCEATPPATNEPA